MPRRDTSNAEPRTAVLLRNFMVTWKFSVCVCVCVCVCVYACHDGDHKVHVTCHEVSTVAKYLFLHETDH